MKEFNLMPFTQVFKDSCDHNGCVMAARRPGDKSFWLSTDIEIDLGKPPMHTQEEILQHISRCRVCYGTQRVFARHSYTSAPPECPPKFHALWTGFSHMMVSFILFRKVIRILS